MISTAESSLVAQARRIVPREWLIPRPGRYAVDFLTTIVVAHALTITVQVAVQAALQTSANAFALCAVAVAFLASVAASFRGLMFVHEVAHRTEPEFRPFRIAWNLLAGIPFLVPSFLYDPHLEHHRAGTYGTPDDGEYLPPALRTRWGMALFVASGLVVPALLFVRFAALAPLSWALPPVRRWTWGRASTLVVNPGWERPLKGAWSGRVLLQEAGCFGWCVVLVATPVALPINSAAWALHLYAFGAALATLNAVRTLGAHRWRGDGSGFTFDGQTFDSVNIESGRPWEIILNPVGLRFHALHHLLPGAPYHALPAAHSLLKRDLPAELGYSRLSAPGVLHVIAGTWRAAGSKVAIPTNSAIAPQSGERHDA
ncbi:MAG: fatty acid desaturase [Planctomycetaceae bacterium]|nr:fatty acid desaturase [Planctomycetaceae bacterium]